MPMVLRSRKSLHRGRAPEVELRNRTPRRSTRLHSSATFEFSDEADSDSAQSRVMAELEEDTPEEADVTELKNCSVVLDRLLDDDKPAKKDFEEKEDMNRKGGKLTSRIPTFHKRPTGGSPNTELNVPKKDTPAQLSQPSEKGGSEEASKSKLFDVRGLPPPFVRVPKTSFDAPFALGMEHVGAGSHSSLSSTPKSQSVEPPFPVVSPRPSLRSQQVFELEKGEPREIEAQTMPEAPMSHPLYKDSINHNVADEPEECNTAEASEPSQMMESSHMESIMDEEPPWETQQVNMPDLKESTPNVVEPEEKFTDEEHEDLGKGEERYEPLLCKSESVRDTKDGSTFAAAPEKPAKASKSTKGNGCCSFGFFYFLPTMMLLLGGFGHHVWHYGLPMSVAQLAAQLELHMFEGLGLVPEACSTDCRVSLVESIPEGLYKDSHSSGRSITGSWLHLLDNANSSVHIAAFYFTLRGNDSVDSTDAQGREVFEQLKKLESKGVKLQIAVNGPQTSTQDTADLAATGAEVREVDLKLITGGIVHTKLWVVDQKHLYLGSANMDWRSLSQVKEVGLSVEDCSCLAQDAFRIFGVYWNLGGVDKSLPLYWPARLSALSSSHNPLHLKFNGVPAQVYMSSAPAQISARGRSDDLSAILSVIADAQKLIYISVMDYLPLSEFTKPLRFWPDIDSALRAAACTRGVQVRLLVSCWEHSPAAMFTFLQSLLVLNRPPLECDVVVKIFTVPSTAEQMKIPFARVNHAKYMVTDRAVYIGTSNWSESYFTQTAGVGLVVNQTGSEVKEGQETLQSQTEELFLRDWTSQYASTLSVDDVDVCPRGK